jgi:hypothetical protein
MSSQHAVQSEAAVHVAHTAVQVDHTIFHKSRMLHSTAGSSEKSTCDVVDPGDELKVLNAYAADGDAQLVVQLQGEEIRE